VIEYAKDYMEDIMEEEYWMSFDEFINSKDWEISDMRKDRIKLRSNDLLSQYWVLWTPWSHQINDPALLWDLIDMIEDWTDPEKFSIIKQRYNELIKPDTDLPRSKEEISKFISALPSQHQTIANFYEKKLIPYLEKTYWWEYIESDGWRFFQVNLEKVRQKWNVPAFQQLWKIDLPKEVPMDKQSSVISALKSVAKMWGEFNEYYSFLQKNNPEVVSRYWKNILQQMWDKSKSERWLGIKIWNKKEYSKEWLQEMGFNVKIRKEEQEVWKITDKKIIQNITEISKMFPKDYDNYLEFIKKNHAQFFKRNWEQFIKMIRNNSKNPLWNLWKKK